MKKIILLILTSVFLFSCRKQKTSWDSDWNIPVVNDTLSLDKFVNDSTLSISPSGMYELDLHRTLMDVNLTDLITIPDTTIKTNYTLSVNSLVLAPGSNFVNPLQIEEHPIDLKDVQLKKIRLKKGAISLKLSNPVGTKTYFTITLPGVTKNGIDFQHLFIAPPGSQSNPGIIIENVDISGYDMDLTGTNGGSYNVLQSNVAVKTDPSGPTVTITNQDVTKVEATIKNIKVDYARGYFGNKIISDTTTTTIDALSKLIAGSIDLPSTNLSFTISNGLKISAKATLFEIKSENYASNSVTLQHPQIGQPMFLDPATGTWDNFTPSIKTIQFNSQNSNLENYLENLGSKHSIGYSIQLNPWGNVSGGWNEIFPNSKLKVSIDAQMPLTIGFNGLTAQDTFDFDLNQDEKKSHISSGKFSLATQNSFPFGCEIKLFLLDKSGNLLYTIAGDEKVTSSLYGSNYTSQGLIYSNSIINFDLSEEIIKNISSINKIVVRAKVDSPSPVTGTNQQIIITEGAFLGVKLKAIFKLKASI